MVGRKGPGSMFLHRFPGCRRERPARAAPGRRRRRGRRVQPSSSTNRFLQRGGQIPGRQVFLKMAVWEAMAAAISLPPVLYCSSGRWRGRTGGRGGSGGLRRGHGGSFHLLLRCGAGASEPTKGPGPPGSRRHRRPGKRPNDGVFSGAPAPEAFGAAPEREFVGQNNRNIGSCRFSFQKAVSAWPWPWPAGERTELGTGPEWMPFLL